MKKYKKTKSSRDGLEILEDRRLLSAAVVSGASLNLVGDANQSNSFLVRAAPSNRVLGFSNNFGRCASLSTVQTVVIYTGSETDTVTVAAGVTAPVEVISPTGTTTWVTAGTTTTFGGVTAGSPGTGSSGSSGDSSGTTTSGSGNGSSSTGSGTSSSGSGSSSSGSGTSSSGSGSSSSGSGTSSSGSGTSSSGSGTSSSGSGSSSSGSGTSSSGSGSSSSGSGTSSSGGGSSSSGSGTSSSGSGSSSSGSGSSSSGTGSSGSGSGTSSSGSGSSSTGSGTSSTGSGTTTNPNDPTGPSNPSSPGSSTPKPVITVTSPSTILPQESVNVQAIASSFGSGTSINSTIAWNFGDAGSAYNNLVGFNAAHAYAKAGTYTITLTITTPDGHVGVATQLVTIAPDNRPTIYVSSSGNDGNNGLSANSPIQSIAKLNELLTSNTRVLFQDGDTFDMGSGVVINVGGMSHVYIGSYGSGAQPILMYNGPATEGVLIGLSGSTSNLVVQGLTFNSIYTNNNDSKAIPSALYMQGNDITVSDNTFLNLLSDLGAAANAPTNVLVQDNSSPDPTALNAYFYFVGGNEIVVVGNTVADSVGEAVLRVGGANDILLADNNFREVPGFGTTSGGKNVLSIQEGTYAYIYNNTLNTGPVEIGPIGTANAVKTGIFQYAVFDSNTLINGANFVIDPNAQEVTYKNNVVTSDGSTGFTIGAQEIGSGFSWQVQNIWIEDNTVVDTSSEWGGFLSINDGQAAGVHIDNNVFVAPTLELGAGAAIIKDDNDDMNSFAEIKDNVWSLPPSVASFAQGGYFFISANQSAQAGWLTPAEWEATGVPSGDVYQNVNLGATYSVSAGGFTAGSDLPTA